ncbi:MAG: DUF1287 domain-containing protein [Armatimonadetes bacterium]|nr:DUF1287 domain-containing protein [Armatimonadota bacterium]
MFLGQVTSRKVSYIVGGRIVLSGEKDVLLEKWRLVSFSLKNPAALEQVRRLLPYVKTRGREGRKVEGATGDFSPRLLQELAQVCTDVIWRALQNAGYDLKAMLDADIKRNVRDYPQVNGRPEPNIDFRRVPNQLVFFKKHARSLTTEIKPKDPENLKQWQGGDIVVFGQPGEHIGIVSDRRRPDGVPLLIHNAGPRAAEEDRLLAWPSKITGHFRFSAGKQEVRAGQTVDAD